MFNYNRIGSNISDLADNNNENIVMKVNFTCDPMEIDCQIIKGNMIANKHRDSDGRTTWQLYEIFPLIGEYEIELTREEFAEAHARKPLKKIIEHKPSKFLKDLIEIYLTVKLDGRKKAEIPADELKEIENAIDRWAFSFSLSRCFFETPLSTRVNKLIAREKIRTNFEDEMKFCTVAYSRLDEKNAIVHRFRENGDSRPIETQTMIEINTTDFFD